MSTTRTTSTTPPSSPPLNTSLTPPSTPAPAIEVAAAAVTTTPVIAPVTPPVAAVATQQIPVMQSPPAIEIVNAAVTPIPVTVPVVTTSPATASGRRVVVPLLQPAPDDTVTITGTTSSSKSNKKKKKKKSPSTHSNESNSNSNSSSNQTIDNRVDLGGLKPSHGITFSSSLTRSTGPTSRRPTTAAAVTGSNSRSMQARIDNDEGFNAFMSSDSAGNPANNGAPTTPPLRSIENVRDEQTVVAAPSSSTPIVIVPGVTAPPVANSQSEARPTIDPTQAAQRPAPGSVNDARKHQSDSGMGPIHPPQEPRPVTTGPNTAPVSSSSKDEDKQATNQPTDKQAELKTTNPALTVERHKKARNRYGAFAVLATMTAGAIGASAALLYGSKLAITAIAVAGFFSGPPGWIALGAVIAAATVYAAVSAVAGICFLYRDAYLNHKKMKQAATASPSAAGHSHSSAATIAPRLSSAPSMTQTDAPSQTGSTVVVTGHHAPTPAKTAAKTSNRSSGFSYFFPCFATRNNQVSPAPATPQRKNSDGVSAAAPTTPSHKHNSGAASSAAFMTPPRRNNDGISSATSPSMYTSPGGSTYGSL